MLFGVKLYLITVTVPLPSVIVPLPFRYRPVLLPLPSRLKILPTFHPTVHHHPTVTVNSSTVTVTSSTITVPSFVTVDCATGDEWTTTVNEVMVTVGWTVNVLSLVF